jgi:excisionase family DNA binding protein
MEVEQPMEVAECPATDVLTPGQVAQLLQLGKSTVYRALESGEIPGRKICGRWRSDRAEVLALVRSGQVPKPQRAADPMPRARRAGSVRAEVIELRRSA